MLKKYFKITIPDMLYIRMDLKNLRLLLIASNILSVKIDWQQF
jgi:hypothetical protein